VPFPAAVPVLAPAAGTARRLDHGPAVRREGLGARAGAAGHRGIGVAAPAPRSPFGPAAGRPGEQVVVHAGVVRVHHRETGRPRALPVDADAGVGDGGAIGELSPDP